MKTTIIREVVITITMTDIRVVTSESITLEIAIMTMVIGAREEVRVHLRRADMGTCLLGLVMIDMTTTMKADLIVAVVEEADDVKSSIMLETRFRKSSES